MTSLNPRFLYRSKELITSVNSLRAFCSYTSDRTKYKPNFGQKGNAFKQKHSRYYSHDSTNSFNVLTESTMFVQDGVNIEELPVLIRRASRNSYPFISHSYTGEKIVAETEFDSTFRQVLQNCSSVNDVFRLLEVPSDKVRGYSAAFALQRLHVLKHLNTDWSLIHSFIRSAVMRELYDTVEKDIGLLSNATLISLVDCYLAAEGFSMSCLNAINTEVQIRLGEGNFSIEELLTLACILKSGTEQIVKNFQSPSPSRKLTMSIVSENASRFLSNEDQEAERLEQFDKYCAKRDPQVREEIKAHCQELSKNVWVHLFSRYKDINEDTLPLTLQALPQNFKSMVSLLEKPLKKIWVDLSPECVAVCLTNLLRLRVNNATIMTHLSRWSYVNIHKITPPLLITFLNTFLHFNFMEENLFKVIEKCLQLKGLKVQTNVIAMCVEYCRCNRYLSPVVMDVAAKHFSHYGYSYEPLQLFAVLRAFGQLNYLPTESTNFLKMVESCLWERFDHLNEIHLLEILASFTFINILPTNFVHRVANDYYFNKVGKLKSPEKFTALTWLKVMKHAIIMDMTDDPQKCLTWLMNKNNKGSVSFYLDTYKSAAKSVKKALTCLFGPKLHYCLPFYGCHTVHLDINGLPLEVSKSESGELSNKEQIVQKIALLLRSADHFLVNTKQLMGVQAQRLSHLKKLGYIPVEIRVSEILYAERISENALLEVIKQHLSPHVNFDILPKLSEDPVNQMQSVSIDQSLSEWLGYDDLLNHEPDNTNDLELIKALLKCKLDSEKTNQTPNDPIQT